MARSTSHADQSRYAQTPHDTCTTFRPSVRWWRFPRNKVIGNIDGPGRRLVRGGRYSVALESIDAGNSVADAHTDIAAVAVVPIVAIREICGGHLPVTPRTPLPAIKLKKLLPRDLCRVAAAGAPPLHETTIHNTDQ